MARVYATYNCEDCGQATRRRRDRDQPRVCEACGQARIRKHCTSISRKEGPDYERWRAGIAAFAARVAAGE